MKIPFPAHVPYFYAFCFALTLFAVELVQGTTPFLALLTFAYVILTVVAFNAASGLHTPSGAYVFFVSLLTVGIGLVGKAVLGEPLQTNLMNVQDTMSVYVVGQCAMAAAAIASRRFVRKPAFLDGILRPEDANKVAYGCILMAIVPYVIPPGAFARAFNQLNNFGYLAILISVYYRVRATNGRKCFTLPAGLMWLVGTAVWGIYTFSKQGMFSASLAWMAAATAAGYRFSLRQIVLIVCGFVFAAVYLVPVSQYGRNWEAMETHYESQLDAAMDLTLHPRRTRELYLRHEAETEDQKAADFHWFNKRDGLLDRSNMFSIDDALVTYTNGGHYEGLRVLGSQVLNIVPGFLYPDKPILRWGNFYAHELGALGEDDETTGVAFSPYAEAYHSGGWLGVSLLLFGILFALFTVVDSVAGTTETGPWVLFYTLIFAHTGPEGGTGGPLYTLSVHSYGLVLVAYVCAKILPLFGAIISGPNRRVLRTQPISQ